MDWASLVNYLFFPSSFFFFNYYPAIEKFQESYLGSIQLCQKIYSLLPNRENCLYFLGSDPLGSDRDLGDHLGYSPIITKPKSPGNWLLPWNSHCALCQWKSADVTLLLAVGCRVVMIKGGRLVESMWIGGREGQGDLYARITERVLSWC